jgi:protease-4
MSEDRVDESARGRIWTGEQARERGLVDDMGTLADAIALAEEMAGVKDARVLEINPGFMNFGMPGMPPGMAVLLGVEPPDPLKSVPDDIRDVIEFYKSISEYERGEALYLMPYTLEELNLDSRE